MSANQPSRATAKRVLAAELNDATHTFRESDDERAPVYALLPTGERCNRAILAGTLIETEDVGTDNEYWRGRLNDPSGSAFVYAGQYQPDPMGTLKEVAPPEYVVVMGKPRTFERDDGGVNVSIRPEWIQVVEEGNRHRVLAQAAEQTLARIRESETEYDLLAEEKYDADPGTYHQAVIETLEDLEDALK